MSESTGFIFGGGNSGTGARPAPPPGRPLVPPPTPVPAPRLPDDAAPVAVFDWVEAPLDEADVSLDQLLDYVVRSGASDLHLASDQVPRIRLNGALEPIPAMGRVTEPDLRGMLTTLMNDRQRRIFDEHNDIDLAYAFGNRARFRVSVLSQRDRIGAVLRLIPSKIMTAEEMNLPPALTALSQLPRGLVLVTGPTGSGKSTLLTALVDLANRTRKAHILTVEDPIEFTHVSKMATVTQREVGRDTDSFASGLRAALRQDPDIILVGEMRDLETTKAALEAAETGHLVFATLHTKSAPESVSRIVNQFPDEVQNQIQATLASSLEAVVTQILVRTADGAGRVPAREVMILGHDVRAQIRQGKLAQIASVLQTGAERGMHTLNADLARLVNEGTIAWETATEVCSDLDELKRRTTRKDV